MSQNIMPRRKAEVRWEWIGDAWKLFTNNPGAWIGMTLITAVIAIVLVVLPMAFILIPAGIFASNNEPGAAFATAGVALLLLIPVLLIVTLAAGAYLSGGMYRAAIRQARGETISVGDLFSGGDCFARVLGVLVLLVVAQIVVAVVFSIPGMVIKELAQLGSLASNIPAAIISGFTFFSIPLIVDRNMGVFEAIGASIETTKSQWWMFAIFVFVLSLLTGIGVLGCGVGILVTAPFYFTTPAVAYRDTFGLPGARNYDEFPIPPPPPDYRSYTPSPMSTPQAPPQFESTYRPDPAPRPEPTYRPAPPPQPQAQPESTTTTCPHCGATLNRTVNFCNQCGRPLSNA